MKKLSLTAMGRNQPLSPAAKGYAKDPRLTEIRDSAVKLIGNYYFYRIVCMCKM